LFLTKKLKIYIILQILCSTHPAVPVSQVTVLGCWAVWT